jgi:hypothetical protein
MDIAGSPREVAAGRPIPVLPTTRGCRERIVIRSWEDKDDHGNRDAQGCSNTQ